MGEVQAHEFTLLLEQWSAGDRTALNTLMPVIYGELRRIALARLRSERPEHTLQATALVHEAYLKLCEHRPKGWRGRSHFFSVASHMMREILVDHARHHRAGKRSGGARVTWTEALSVAPERADMLLELDEALDHLGRFDERKRRLVELKYFGGLSGEEIAEVLGISVSTITRESRLAEAWLNAYLKSDAGANTLPE